jgi:ornithine cyclodeaminase/alanine dehydrogenase-like protein (mu-crystallin family)
MDKALTPPPPIRSPAALLLNRTEVTQLITLDDCILAVEKAFAAHARGQSLASGILHVDADGGEFHLKAGGTRGKNSYFAAKINGGFFQNRARTGLPNIQGLIVLYDASNGCPLAVMESGAITVLRTGAATAVAAKHLARPGSSVVTIAGVGMQGAVQLRALSKVLPLNIVHAWSRDPSRSAAFAAAMSRELSLDVRPAVDLRAATRLSQVIVTCTPAHRWFLGRDDVAPGTFISAVGTDSPDKQEIEPELLAASAVVPDLLPQSAEVGDLHHAIAAGLMSREQIRGELGQVIIGAVQGRRDNDEIVIFDSTGTALQDVATAATVYERALAERRGTRFEFAG